VKPAHRGQPLLANQTDDGEIASWPPRSRIHDHVHRLLPFQGRRLHRHQGIDIHGTKALLERIKGQALQRIDAYHMKAKNME